MAKICYFLSIKKDWLNPFKCSETIGNYVGRWYRWYMMLLGWTTDYRGWPTDYGRCWKMLEDDKKICLLQINNNSLNPFKCFEMILNYKGKMIDEVNRTEGDLQTKEDDLHCPTDYGRWPTDYGRWPSVQLTFINLHFRTLKWIQTGLVSLNIIFLVIFRHA